MLVGYTASDYQNWTNQIHGYEKEKRTKKPFGKQFSPSASIVKIQEVRQKQRQFNPVLQKYNNQKQQIKEISKEQSSRIVSLDHYYRTVGRNNQRKYDIINLHGVDNINENQKNFKVRNPIRNLYNPINNQLIPQNFYRNREVRLSPEKTFKNIKPEGREFDIVTGIYHYDHQQKKYQEMEQKNRKIKQKYDKTHDYNSVMGRYYDQQKQIEYENMLATSQKKQSMGDEYNKRFPPGYINRQPLILDQTKPLSQSLIALDNKREKAKQRYKLKYLIEKQYQKRNMEHQQNQQRKLINRVHNSHSMDNKAKQFYLSQLPLMENQILLGRDRRIIQNNQNPQISSGSLSSRQSYNQSQKSSSMINRSYLIRGRIKSGGFF